MANWERRHRIIPAVFLIFREGDNVLLLLRANTGYMDGSYSLPAGHVDGNEPAIVAACREALEEVGAEISPEDLRLVHTMHEMAEGHERINLGFEVQRYGGTLKNMEPDKCDELRRVSIDELPPNTVPQVVAIIKKVRNGEVYSDHNFR
jgi:8-oxo-dGTP diphosphatase